MSRLPPTSRNIFSLPLLEKWSESGGHTSLSISRIMSFLKLETIIILPYVCCLLDFSLPFFHPSRFPVFGSETFPFPFSSHLNESEYFSSSFPRCQCTSRIWKGRKEKETETFFLTLSLVIVGYLCDKRDRRRGIIFPVFFLYASHIDCSLHCLIGRFFTCVWVSQSLLCCPISVYVCCE